MVYFPDLASTLGRPWAAGGDGCPFPSRDHRLRLLDVQAAAICWIVAARAEHTTSS